MMNMGMPLRMNFPIYHSLNKFTRGLRESSIIIQEYDTFLIYSAHTCKRKNIYIYTLFYIIIKKYFYNFFNIKVFMQHIYFLTLKTII